MLRKTKLCVIISLALATVACSDEEKNATKEVVNKATELMTEAQKEAEKKQAQELINKTSVTADKFNPAQRDGAIVVKDKEGNEIKVYKEGFAKATKFDNKGAHGIYQLTKTTKGDVVVAYAGAVKNKGTGEPEGETIPGAVIVFEGGDLTKRKIVNLPFQVHSITTVADKIVAGHTRVRAFSVVDANYKRVATFKPDDAVIKSDTDPVTYRTRYIAPGKDANSLITIGYNGKGPSNVLRSLDINTGAATEGFTVKPYLKPEGTNNFPLLKDGDGYITVGNVPGQTKTSFIKVNSTTGAISNYADIDAGNFDFNILNLVKVGDNFVATNYDDKGVVFFNKVANKLKPTQVAGTKNAIEVAVQEGLVFATNNFRSEGELGNIAVISADGTKVKKISLPEADKDKNGGYTWPLSLATKTNGNNIEVYTSLGFGVGAVAKVTLGKDFLTNANASCNYQVFYVDGLQVTDSKACQVE